MYVKSSGDEDRLYPVTALPPSELGATKLTVISNGDGFGLLIASVTEGMSGTVAVVILPLGDCPEFPTRFVLANL